MGGGKGGFRRVRGKLSGAGLEFRLMIAYACINAECRVNRDPFQVLCVDFPLPESVPAGFEAGPKAVRGIFSAAKAFLPMAGSIGRAE